MANEKKKGVLSRLGGLIFEEETPKKGSVESGKDTSSQSDKPIFGRSSGTNAQKAYVPRAFVPKNQSSESVDPSMLSEVEQALSRRNPPDYLKFVGLLSSLSNSGLDEPEQFKAAVATAPVMKLSLDSVKSAYDERLRVLDELQSEFESQSAQELSDRIDGTEKELLEIDAEASQLEKEVERLQSRQQELKIKRDEKSSSIASDRENITSVRDQMIKAFGAVRAKATTERDILSRNTGGN